MRPRLGAALLLGLLTAAAVPASAQAQVRDDRTYVYNSSGVQLPLPPQVFGQDEVQAAGGVSCRSSISSGGPILDTGVITTQDLMGRDVTTGYVRLVTPLGQRAKRLDCSRLYELEIQRLQMELELARMNLPGRSSRQATSEPSAAAGVVTATPRPR